LKEAYQIVLIYTISIAVYALAHARGLIKWVLKNRDWKTCETTSKKKCFFWVCF